MPRLKFDHVSFLVRNLDQAVGPYQQMLSVLDPEQAKQIFGMKGSTKDTNSDGYVCKSQRCVAPILRE